MDSNLLVAGAHVRILEKKDNVDVAEVCRIENDGQGILKVVRVKSLALFPGKEFDFGIDPEGGDKFLWLFPNPLPPGGRCFSQNAPLYSFELL